MKNKILIILGCVMLLSSGLFSQTTYTVTSTANGTTSDGVSLRWAIEEANNNSGADIIDFSLGAGGPFTITLTSALPDLTDNSGVTINGFENGSNDGTPNSATIFGSSLNPTYKIIIKSSTVNNLITIASSNNIIKGIVFEDCSSTGTLIAINSGTANKILGCYIGMQSNGTTRGAANATIGININGATNSVIGDGAVANANLISGMSNYGAGIQITGSGSTGNSIKGNIIGLQKNGTTLVSNHLQLYGVKIISGAGNNTVGGTASGEGNVISGQYGQYGSGTKKYGVGILLNSNATAGNFVYGNRIGMQSGGATAVSSNTQYIGIRILDSKNNVIGGNSAGHRNVISANGPISYQSQIWGCGILVSGSTSTGNAIKGNYIGLDATGNNYVTNAIQFKGVIFRSVGTGNTLGGSNSGEGNVISGNTCTFGGSPICGQGRGVVIENSSSLTITGNIIGLNYNGTAFLGNAPSEKQYWGIEIDSASTNNIIGGAINSNAKNVISGNSDIGIQIGFLSPTGSTGNVIKGNIIGLRSDGTAIPTGTNIQSIGISITGANSNTIGGSNANEGNVISGNLSSGILLGRTPSPYFLNSYSTTVLGNIIGLTISGAWVTGSTQATGLQIEYSYSNTVGGNTALTRNIISGNVTNGILLTGSTTTTNTIKGNYIGTNINGDAIVSASYTQQVGVRTTSSAYSNTIGGTSSNEGNVISGNTVGIQFNSNSNFVYGNTIGPRSGGLLQVTSSIQDYGIYVDGNSNVIGGNTAGHRNIISANNFAGVSFQNSSTSNTVQGNYIGAGASMATISSSSQDYGVYIANSPNNTIGGSSSGEGNVIAFNTVNGVSVFVSTSVGNKISRNLIYANTGKGINLYYGSSAGNNGKAVPVITSIVGTTVNGTCGANDVVEIFMNNNSNCLDAETYLGNATLLTATTWTYTLSSALISSESLLATATDPGSTKNTSEFTPVALGGTASVTPSAICQGSATTVQLSLSSFVGNIQWQSSSPTNTSFANISGATTSPYTLSPNPSASTYYRAITTIVGCLSNSTSTEVLLTVNPSPVITITPTPATTYAPVTLTASGADTYLWFPNSNLSPNNTVANPLANPAFTTIYTVIGTTTSSGCTGTATFTVDALKTYFQLKRQLDGGYYTIVDGRLYFKYDEEYSDTDGKLKFNIYDDKHDIIVSNVDLPSLVQPNVVYGDNRYFIDLQYPGITFHNTAGYLQGGYHVLEVINEKNEKWYLRFNNTFSSQQ